MDRPTFEVADILRQHGSAYRKAHRTSPVQSRVWHRLTACRTSALGHHEDVCVDCGGVRISYNSCRDRHCPKCQGLERAEWLQRRLERILPVPHFHTVFTLPHLLNPLMLWNPEHLYNLLFRAASECLLELAADPRHLGARIGITAVLHTWAQNLTLHPHLHCVVTGGGLGPDGRWVEGHQRFLLPVKVLGKLFRGKFLDGLEKAWKAGDLVLGGETAHLADPLAWKSFRNQLYKPRWVVYCKRPFGGAEQVFRYLGRYTHRVALSNHRILDLGASGVTFTVRARKRKGEDSDEQAPKSARLTIPGVEFIRRFLLHVLPKGFVRIRHYGLLAPRRVGTDLAHAKRVLAPRIAVVPAEQTQKEKEQLDPWWERFQRLTGIDVMACPCCGGRLVRRTPEGTPGRSPPETA